MKHTIAVSLVIFVLSLVACAQSSGKTSHLTPAYSNAAVTALNEWDDKNSHAFKIARDIEAKTAADKLSARRLGVFLQIHMLNVIIAGSMFDDEKNHAQIREQTKCKTQWIQNLRYNDTDVPSECGLKF